jgi:hypothetical protein
VRVCVCACVRVCVRVCVSEWVARWIVRERVSVFMWTVLAQSHFVLPALPKQPTHTCMHAAHVCCVPDHGLQARIDAIPVKMGLEVYEQGISTGISDEAWETIHATKILLKVSASSQQ